MMVMKNILCTTAPLHRRFDLKGSTQGRYTKKTLKELKPTSILKDLDLDLMFQVSGGCGCVCERERVCV